MVPRFTEFYIPVLEVMSNVEPIEINALIDKVADHINLSEEDKQILTESGNQYRYRSNISWAVTDLNQGNFIERVKRGFYVITLAGLELLEENIEKMDRELLSARSESFRAFMEKKGTRKGKKAEGTEVLGELVEETDAESEDGNHKELNKKEELSEVSLDELYSIRETLKKAKISTNDIDVKIKELENDSFFNILMPRLSNLLPELFRNMKDRVVFTVEYVPDRQISIQLGETKRTKLFLTNGKDRSQDFVISERTPEKRYGKQSYAMKSETDAETSEKLNQAHEKTISTENNGIISKGVWIEHYKDRMIVVKGDIEPLNDLFTSYGGRIINNPTEGWKGWIFMSNREEGLRKDLEGFLISSPSLSLSEVASVGKKENIHDSEDSEHSELISKYIGVFGSLRRFNFLGITGPHKAIMIIAIFNGIRMGLFQDHKIKFSSALETLYNEAWEAHIGGKPSLGAVYPFVHLGKDAFFMHKLLRPITEYDKTWNPHTLERHIDYAILEKKLVDGVKKQKVYDKLVGFLKDKYCAENIGRSKDFNIYERKSIEQKAMAELSKGNLRELFKEYSLKTPAKHGRLYSKLSVQVYANSLISDTMKEIVSEYISSGDIYEIYEVGVLVDIKQKVDSLSMHDKTLLTSRSALALYIKFIQNLNNRKLIM